ncbi:hypothetical protein KUCAC02_015246, partial [Chaenocephalus aceratus]
GFPPDCCLLRDAGGSNKELNKLLRVHLQLSSSCLQAEERERHSAHPGGRVLAAGHCPLSITLLPQTTAPMKDTRGQLKTSQGLYSVSLSEVLIVDLSAVQELSEVCEEFHADCCLLLLGGTSLLKPLASQLAKEPLSSSHGTEREWTFLSGFL